MRLYLRIIALVLLCITFIGCNYKAKREAEIVNLKIQQNYIVDAPNNWRAFINHNQISYTPIRKR